MGHSSFRRTCACAIITFVVPVDGYDGRSALAQPEQVATARNALEARWGRADHLCLASRWRTYRCADNLDWLDKGNWTRPLAGIDPDYDIAYRIVRPWMYFELKDVNNTLDFTPAMSWVDGRLTTRGRMSDGREYYRIVGHLNYSTLRGKTFFTPIELEMFDTKKSFREMLGQATDATAERRSGALIEVKFGNPIIGVGTLRGVFDESRDWVPMELEQNIPAEGSRKELRYLLKTTAVMALGSTCIISEAIIMNSNPNVLPEVLVITHYKVDHAEKDDSLTVDSVRIVPSRRDSAVQDDVGLTYHEYDGAGRVVLSKRRTQEDLERHAAAMQAAAVEASKAGEYRRQRRSYFWFLTGSAALLVGGTAYWFLRRARAVRV